MTDESKTIYPYGYASFIKRLTASSIDTLILGFLSYIINASSRSGLSLGGFLSLVYIFYFWIKQDGQTLGKKAMGIQIVRENQQPIDISTALIRYLGYIVSSLFFGLGYLWVIFDPKKQAWHDKLAKTYVINTDSNNRTGLIILFNLVSLVFLILLLVFVVIAIISIIGTPNFLLNHNPMFNNNFPKILTLPTPTISYPNNF